MMGNGKTAYCEICDKETSYITNIVEKKGNFKGVDFRYEYIVAKCKKCGEEVFPSSIGKENFIRMTDAYKKAVGLLTSKELIDIRKRMNLSQRELAKLIKCGEKNIARYENGSIQLHSIDKSIRELVENKRISNECYLNDYSSKKEKIFLLDRLFFVSDSFSYENNKKESKGSTKWKINCI